MITDGNPNPSRTTRLGYKKGKKAKAKTKKKVGYPKLPEQAAPRAVDAVTAAMERRQSAMRAQGMRAMKRKK